MALIKCTECGKEISDAAVKCPHCGKEKSPAKTEVKTGKGIKPLWFIIGGVVGLLVLVVIGLYYILPMFGLTKSPFAQLSLPKPVIVSSFCSNEASTFLDEGTRVWAEIRNDGVAGDVVFETTVSQGSNQWTKTLTLPMGPKETKKFVIDFMETKLGGGEKSFTVKTYPLR